MWQVIGMPSPEMNFFIYVVHNKFLGKGSYGRHPWIRLAMDCERMVEKEYTLFYVWEPPMIYLAWKILGILGRFR